ncbi:MAG TPA: BA3454 family stress response protein [Pseudoneobacillus sp.]|nr:BA3454 family stress response protein [Pseudoneobacillus sp.]
MYQYIISITFQGKQYQTNVITNKDTTELEVFQLALEQVQMQWGNKKDHS